jgi:hypothetical protein
MTETVSENTEPTWFIDEGRAGIGERPAWLPEKFKSTAELAKSYTELEKKISVVPEDYDLSRSKFLDKDYGPIQDFLQLAKDKRVPKDVIDKMVESVDKYMDEFTIDPREEEKKLGDNAPERLKVLDNWAKANLSDTSYKALASNLKSADAIKALEELRGKMMSNNPVVPNGNDAASTSTPTLKELETELSNNLDKYKKDPVYRKDIQSRMELVVKTSGMVDKVGA